MAEATDADREKAAALAPEHQSWCRYDAHGDCCGWEPWDCDCGTWDVQHQIAAALAEEREKARAPFRDLVAFYDRHEYTTMVVDDVRHLLDSAQADSEDEEQS